MIKEIKSKVFMIVMISLSVMIISIICVINIANYNQSRQESYDIVDKASNMLKQMSLSPLSPPGNTDRIEDLDKPKDMLYFNTSQFYFVMVENNEIVKTVNENTEGYSNDKINEYAFKILEKNKTRGSIGNLVYVVKDIRNNKIITFMDNIIPNQGIRKIFILSVLIGLISLIFAFFISRKISIWLVKPIEETLNKQKQFISDASHELKTPLAVICANSDTLEGEIGENKWLKYIQKEVSSMDNLVNSLLSLARIENKDNVMKFDYFDLSKTILGGTMVFESLAYENEIELIDSIDDNLKLKGNSSEIKQLLSILLDNAIKHTKKGGQIIVSLNKSKNNIVLKVKNSGEPISKGEEEKIFERFYRSDESRNRDSKRYGLGLSIAKTIAEKHNAKIKVSWEDGFTTFTVIFLGQLCDLKYLPTRSPSNGIREF